MTPRCHDATTSRLPVTPEMRRRRRAYPLTNRENQAYCVMQWLSGETQRDIAAQFGYAGPSAVSTAIWRLIFHMDEDYTEHPRQPVAMRALMKFLAERGMPVPSAKTA